MKEMKRYEAPELTFLQIRTEDILTLSSNGFEGEEHEFREDPENEELL